MPFLKAATLGKYRLEFAWAALVLLSLGGLFLGESGDRGLAVTALIAGIMVLKGRLVIDFFLELSHANPTLRRMVRLYGISIPLLLLFSELLARLWR